MKNYIGIILLSGTLTLLPGQEEVTGKALKDSFKEYRSAASKSNDFKLNGEFLSGEAFAYDQVLVLLNKKDATIESVKLKIQNNKKELDNVLKERNKNAEAIYSKSGKTFDHLNTLIDRAAAKIK